MNKNLLNDDIQNYINENLNADVNRILLAKTPFANVSPAEIANQITAKKKAEKKLPTWYKAEKIYFPSVLSIEQTSSETTAIFKSNLALGESLIDITGGFGVDAHFFSEKIKQVTHCEINSSLSKIASHNSCILKTDNITFVNDDGIGFLKKSDQTFDTIYIDPARRSERGKVFMFKDCTPNVVDHLELFKSKSKRIIIKSSPLLDITAGLLELNQVSAVYIISVKNECKELLWVLDGTHSGPIKVIAVTLNEKEKRLVFELPENTRNLQFANQIIIGDFLYEPDVALLKSGAFNLIGERYGVNKLHPQSQLYTSKILNKEFPGRIFKINEILTANDLKKDKELKGNVIVRNYPAKSEDLIKKHKIKTDKELFLVFTRITNGEKVIFKSKIIQYY